MTTSIPPSIPPGRCPKCGPRFGGQIETIKARFETFLSENSFKPIHTLPGVAPALRVLSNEHTVLSLRLGEKFLGVSLGGSLIHGLGTVKTSDVDYRIYTRKIDEVTAEGVKHESWYRLRHEFLNPCDGDPVSDLERRPVQDLTPALSVFTNLIIDPPDRGAPGREQLEQAALAAIQAAINENIVPKPELLSMLKEEHSQLVGLDPAHVASKFMQNRASEFIMEGAALALSFDEPFMNEMIGIARDYMSGRVRYCPFPPRVEELFH